MAAALAIVLTVLIVREWGGRVFAQLVAGLAMLIAPAFLRMGSILCIPVFEPLYYVLSDLEITVEEQLVDGDGVTSRFVVAGTGYGRRVRFNGITISRFEKGLIVEDWSVTDTLGMLRQLGAWRSISMGVRSWQKLTAALAPQRVRPRSPGDCSTSSG